MISMRPTTTPRTTTRRMTTGRMTTGRGRRALAALGALGLAVGLAACSGDNGVQNAAQQQGAYVAGSGQIEKIASGSRGEPVSLSGTTLTGSSLSIDSERGKVVVLNVWGSWCEPCIKEMPQLQSAWSAYQKKKSSVAFVGIDQESADNGRAFAESVGLTFPSISDESGTSRLSLQGKAGAAPPVTLILDKQGRIAARILGELPSKTTLTELVDEVAGESA